MLFIEKYAFKNINTHTEATGRCQTRLQYTRTIDYHVCIVSIHTLLSSQYPRIKMNINSFWVVYHVCERSTSWWLAIFGCEREALLPSELLVCWYILRSKYKTPSIVIFIIITNKVQLWSRISRKMCHKTSQNKNFSYRHSN